MTIIKYDGTEIGARRIDFGMDCIIADDATVIPFKEVLTVAPEARFCWYLLELSDRRGYADFAVLHTNAVARFVETWDAIRTAEHDQIVDMIEITEETAADYINVQDAHLYTFKA